jgi:hypothetical protein
MTGPKSKGDYVSGMLFCVAFFLLGLLVAALVGRFVKEPYDAAAEYRRGWDGP